MKKVRLGGFVCKGVLVFIEETPVDTLTLKPGEPLTVALGLQDLSMDIDLSDIQNLKRLLNTAESRLRLRQDQALRARNLTLDL